MSFCFFTLLKMPTETVKIENTISWKSNDRSCYIAILSKSWKGLELVFSLHSRAKNKMQMFVLSSNYKWLNLIIPRILVKQSKVYFSMCSNVYDDDDVTVFELLISIKNTKM